MVRIKDENKKEAIFLATIRLINEVGYANISMSKIAREAGVSASTLYTYYENKEDMFKKVYTEAKKVMLATCNKDIEVDDPVQQSVNKLCRNLLTFMREQEDYFLFIEQSSNSTLVTPEMLESLSIHNLPIFLAFERGIAQGILKNASPLMLIGFCVYPITQIYKENCNANLILQDNDIEVIFSMCWDAIKQ